MTVGTAVLTKTDLNGNTFNITELSQLSGDGIFVESGDFDLGHSQRLKEIDAVRVEMTQGGSIPNMGFFLGYKENLNDAVTWMAEQSLASGDETFWLRPPAALFFRIKIRDTAPQVQWQLSRVQLFGRVVGGNLG